MGVFSAPSFYFIFWGIVNYNSLMNIPMWALSLLSTFGGCGIRTPFSLMKFPLLKNYRITLIRGNYETLDRQKFFITVSIQDFRQVQMLLLSQRRLRLHVPKHPGTNVQKHDFLLIHDVIKIWKNWQFPSCIPVPMSSF